MTSYANLKHWAETTNRRFLNLALTKDAIARIDELRAGRTFIDPISGRERPIGRAQIIEELVSAGSTQ